MTSEHPDQRYTRQCPAGCGFTAPYREDWDEGPAMTHCANCGVPLERISCPSCGAPVMWETTQALGRTNIRKAPFCTYCGAETTVKERKMRTKPKARRPTGGSPEGLFATDADLEARLRRKMGGA